MKAWAFRASRIALVATTRTESVTTCWVARWKRRRNLYRFGDGLRGEKAGAEYAFAEARDFAVLVQAGEDVLVAGARS